MPPSAGLQSAAAWPAASWKVPSSLTNKSLKSTLTVLLLTTRSHIARLARNLLLNRVKVDLPDGLRVPEAEESFRRFSKL